MSGKVSISRVGSRGYTLQVEKRVGAKDKPGKANISGGLASAYSTGALEHIAWPATLACHSDFILKSVTSAISISVASGSPEKEQLSLP